MLFSWIQKSQLLPLLTHVGGSQWHNGPLWGQLLSPGGDREAGIETLVKRWEGFFLKKERNFNSFQGQANRGGKALNGKYIRRFASRNIFNKRKFGFLKAVPAQRFFSRFYYLKMFSSHYSLNNSTTSLIVFSRVYLIVVSTFNDLGIKSIYSDIMMFRSTGTHSKSITPQPLDFSFFPQNVPFGYIWEKYGIPIPL